MRKAMLCSQFLLAQVTVAQFLGTPLPFITVKQWRGAQVFFHILFSLSIIEL